MRSNTLPLLFLTLFFTTLLAACASGGSDSYSATDSRAAGVISTCKVGDKMIPDSSTCLQDDAACYELSTGSWCTGQRGMSCPTGSSALKKGQACPPGSKCFASGPSLNCAINLN